MSSGFVSGGTADEPIKRDDEWLKAQQELEATRRRKEEESRQTGGKSLYEVLQQNKGKSVNLCNTAACFMIIAFRLTPQLLLLRGSCKARCF